MNILIDTNILIPLEDTSKVLDENFARIRKLSSEQRHALYLHSIQMQDIDNDTDENRKAIMRSRTSLYSKIPEPPLPTQDDLDKLGWKESKSNDRIDNTLLYALHRGAVHLLITNDGEIHRKARQSGDQERVYHLQQFLHFLEARQPIRVNPPPGITRKLLHEFDISLPFFDSLRKGYSGFNEWYLKAAREHREAWCAINGSELCAICIFKFEENEVLTDDGEVIRGKILKLCTFKVDASIRGRKVGERLLFSAFKYAVEYDVDWVYLHVFGEEHGKLTQLCLDYGFKFLGKYKEKEDVYLKAMKPPNGGIMNDALAYAISYYPYYRDDIRINKFIIPIQKHYHENLFPDTSDSARGLFRTAIESYSPQSNTIKKAYICHSPIKKIRPGDLLCFFRTQDRHSIECIGIAESVVRTKDIEYAMSLVSKRTVYSRDALSRMLQKDALIILFRHLADIAPIGRDILENSGIRGSIQSIREITHNQYCTSIKRDKT